MVFVFWCNLQLKLSTNITMQFDKVKTLNMCKFCNYADHICLDISLMLT